MLQFHGFVRQDPLSRAYLAGSTLIEIGLEAVRNLDIREATRPYLERVRDAVGETAHLVVLSGTDAFFLDSVETDRAVRAGPRIGALIPAHCTASGKVLLAYLSQDEFRARYPDETFPGLTSTSIVSRLELERELKTVRERRYATNFGESEADLAAIATPVFGPVGWPIAALSLSAPLARFSRSDAVRAAATLIAIGADATREIGGSEIGTPSAIDLADHAP
jgi:DNA-binding IclR family transcriptional regulator